MTKDAPSNKGNTGAPTQGSAPFVSPLAPAFKVIWYKPFPLATAIGTGARKTAAPLLPQQGSAPTFSRTPFSTTGPGAGSGNRRCRVTLVSAAITPAAFKTDQ